MKKSLLLVCLFLLFIGTCSWAQVTVSDPFPRVDQPVTIIYDATQGASGLVGASRVKMHSGVILTGPTGTSWQHVVGAWGDPSSAGEMTSLGNNRWSITITPRTYYAAASTPLPANATVYRLGMVFREAGPCGGFGGVSTDCKKGAGTEGNGDIYVNLYLGGYELAVTSPSSSQGFVDQGSEVTFTAHTTDPSTITLKIGGSVKSTVSGQNELNYVHTITESGNLDVTIESTNGSETKTKNLSYVIRSAPVTQPRPAGIVPGINYSADQTKATLCFLAPLKNSVYALGDFTAWKVDGNYQMKKDGNYFWLEITGLTPGQEYAFQYMVDETLRVADPFAEKLLDPGNDQYITASTYPNLKPYPSGASGIVSVLQTAQTPYVWETTGYVRPAKEKLNVYELLVRDFDTPRTFQAVIDKLDYLKTLGINAIELMPVMEFSGNDSWGYNPIFYLAPDKAYGPKNKLKELIDKAHAKGIAVILDMVLNQADYEFPYVKMYWAGSKPAADNPWFNQDATHPFSVFFDFNHESAYTKALVDTINHYWITEYKFDGFRFDLSKGFTQTVNTDVGAWGRKDQSRINILTRMANKIWSYDPTAYVILEHFADDDEEVVLSNSGMMMWGNMTGAFKQNLLGFSSGSDIARTYYKNRTGGTWNNPGAIIGFMESHDEERLIYESIHSGNSATGYNTRVLNTALDRMKGGLTFLFSVPGPKMIWQFGELGYDFSINRCADGSINNNCRTNAKPVRWDYYTDPARENLYKTVSEFLALRNAYSVFHTSDVVISGGNDLYKQITLKNAPYTSTPASANEMNVVVIGNFDVSQQSRAVNFPHTGKWYHFFSRGDELDATVTSMSINLQPGEFRVYTDFKMESTEPELMSFVRPLAPDFTVLVHENRVVNLTWIDNSTIESGFRIFRRKVGSLTYELIGQRGINQTTFTDSALEPLTAYEYYIEAYNATGSDASVTRQVTTSGDVITSVDERILESVSVYPNPATDAVNIDLPEGYVFTVNLVDVNGRTIKRLLSNNNQYSLSGVQAGLYFIKVTGSRNVKYFRFIKR